jgi:hypothetical protein
MRWIRRSIKRCSRKMPKMRDIMAVIATDNNRGVAFSSVEASQPIKLISATTIIPSHSLS